MRTLIRAEILSIGTELTVGETRDTNAGDLARDLTSLGVEVNRLTALPDDLATVRDSFGAALERADLVISTGGLGPTPDDLTREAIAAHVGETPTVDAELEAWLAALFERRGLPYPAANRKQAWLIPAATAIPNANGTAPGWWVDRPDGRVIVALPGPPREMRPMWTGWVLPRLLERGLGRPGAVVTLRTTGLGESLIAERLGALLDRDANPTVATYARADAVDIRISAVDGERPAADLVAEAEAAVVAAIGEQVWARGTTSWPEAVAEALDARGWRLAVVEVATRGSVAALLAEGLGERLAFAETLLERPAPHDGHEGSLEDLAARVRTLGGADVGLAVEARSRGDDMAASVAILDAAGDHRERRIVFLGGPQGRSRVAIAAAAILLARLRADA